MDELEDTSESEDEIQALDHDPIELHLCKGNILVWSADDVRLLRETHHIVGALVGSLPRSPRQNVQLGLPLQLMPEEAAVLIDYDVAKLVNVKVAKRTTEDALAFEEARKRSFQEQQALWDTLNSKKRQDFEQIIAMGRTTKKHRRAERAKDKKRIKAAAAAAAGASTAAGGAAAAKLKGGSNKVLSSSTRGERGGDDSERLMQEDAVVLKTGHHDGEEHTLSANRDSPLTTCTTTSRKPEATSGHIEAEILEGGLNTGSGSGRGNHSDCGVTDADLNSAPERTGSETHPTHRDVSESWHDGDSALLMNNRTRDSTPKQTGSVSDGRSSLSHEGSEVQGRVSLNPSSGLSGRCGVEHEEKTKPCFGEEISEVTVSTPGRDTDDGSYLKESDTHRNSQSSKQHNSDQSANHSSAADRLRDEPVDVATERKEGDLPPASQGVRPEDGDIFKKPADPQPSSGYLVHLVTASPSTLKEDLTEWSFPSTPQEMLKYRIFRDLWETGYYLTSGCKFGGDFLVYPGDPVLFHSYFIAICVPYERLLSPLDLITLGRLGTNVRKTVILCSVDDQDEVVYTSLQWTGFS